MTNHIGHLLAAPDLTPYLPLIAGALFALWKLWQLFKRGRGGQKEDLKKAIDAALAPVEKNLEEAQRLNTILEKQNKAYESEIQTKNLEIAECKKRYSDAEKFNFRLQGEIDDLERRVEELG